LQKILLFLIVIFTFGYAARAQQPVTPAPIGLADFYLAKDDGRGQAGEQVFGFATTDVPIHCVVQLDSLEPATVRMNLIVISVPGVKAGTKVVSTSYTTKESENRVNFSGRPVGEWIAGRYRADIYIGSTLAVSREFAVQKPLNPIPAAEGVIAPRPEAKPRVVKRPRGT
jgi:hypothetical protein